MKVRGLNKSDISTLSNTFGNLQNLFNAGAEELTACPGIGKKKSSQIAQSIQSTICHVTSNY